MIQLTIVGNIGQDAVVKAIPSGTELCEFSVAASNGKDEEATWVKCAIWGNRGVKVAPYLTKGSKVACTGQMSTREVDGKFFVNLKVDNFTFTGGKAKQDSSNQSSEAPQITVTESFDDDIPF